MNIVVELVGGPLDGQIEELPSALPRIVHYSNRCDTTNDISFIDSGNLKLYAKIDYYRIIYERTEKMTASGHLVYRFLKWEN